ncbi:MAG TPA: alternative ribosome rescue aminoacyl-tRNA hydrolase ArfB [Streptosporangiaceae bacterium]
MPGAIPVRGAAVIPDTELRWRFSRSSGPGGQHVNKTDTAVELSFDLARTASLPAPLKDRALRRLAGRLVDGVLTIRVERHRSQWRNRQEAERRLAALLHEATAAPPKRRRPTKPGRAVTERRLADKRRQAERKRLRRPPD